jgi:hypothetical protein
MRMADASKILEHQFAFDRLAFDGVGPALLGGGRLRMRSPDQPGGDANLVLRLTEVSVSAVEPATNFAGLSGPDLRAGDRRRPRIAWRAPVRTVYKGAVHSQ